MKVEGGVVMEVLEREREVKRKERELRGDKEWRWEFLVKNP